MATAPDAWTQVEVEAIVADYFHMLTLELAGQEYNKSEHRRSLVSKLASRSEGSIERKHSNISAVLIELGCPYVQGYKPLGNYQALLFQVIEERLKDRAFDEVALAAAEMPAAVPLPHSFDKVLVDPPVRATEAHDANRAPYIARVTAKRKRDYLGRESRNISLGNAGEEFTVAFERWRLIASGKASLADKVEHIANTQGDGFGYDIFSFEVNGAERLIEVKTTAFGKETPFFVTRNELTVSKGDSDHYWLYRLFNFRKNPQLFSLQGSIDQHCKLDPITYQASF